MEHLFDMYSAPIEFSKLLATASAWSANSVMYESPRSIVASMYGLAPPVARIVVEPGYFALAAAINLATAYRPEVP